jgi:hypothetical protein
MLVGVDAKGQTGKAEAGLSIASWTVVHRRAPALKKGITARRSTLGEIEHRVARK